MIIVVKPTVVKVLSGIIHEIEALERCGWTGNLVLLKEVLRCGGWYLAKRSSCSTKDVTIFFRHVCLF